MRFFLKHPSNSVDSFQNFLSQVLKMLAVGMTLSSFTAYLTAKYISLLGIPVIPLPSTSSLSNISVITRTSFLLLLVVSYMADDGHSKLNLNKPKGGLLLFSVLFGIFLGSMLEEIISSFLVFYLGGAFFFFIVGLYKSWFRQAENSLESFILGKYLLIFIAIFFQLGMGGGFIEIGFTIIGLIFLTHIYFLCISSLEDVYDYYKEHKSRTELCYIGAFKLYKAFFRFIWMLPRFVLSVLYNVELIRVPKEQKVEIEVEEPSGMKTDLLPQSSETQLTKYLESHRSAYIEKNTMHLFNKSVQDTEIKVK